MNNSFLTATKSAVSSSKPVDRIAALEAELAKLKGEVQPQQQNEQGFEREPLLSQDELRSVCESVKSTLIESKFGTAEEFAFVKGQRTKFIVRYKRWWDKAAQAMHHSNSIELVNGLNGDARVICVATKDAQGNLGARKVHKDEKTTKINSESEELSERIRAFVSNL